MEEQLVKDYVEYFNSDSNVKVDSIEETIEDMLTRLEEFKGNIDMVKSEEAKKRLNIKDLLLLKNQMADVISRIDAMEMFISRVHQDLNTLETKLIDAELDFPEKSDNALKNLFKPILSKISPEITADTNSSTTAITIGTTSRFKKPDLFSTDQFFVPENCDNNS